MKTRVLKSVIPFFVMVLAIGLSFAAETGTTATMGFYEDPIFGVQSVPIGDECQDQAGFSCTFDGHQLYAERELRTPLNKLNP